MSIPSDLLRRGRELLCAAREDQRSWGPLRLQLAAGLDGADEDAHERNRMEVAWALQYDVVSDDAALIRFVLGQEVEWRRVAPDQGIGDTLEILSWLVARDRDVRDVALLARAKTANFDTGCGFDREHLFAGGVEATVAYARAAETPEILGELVTEDGAPMCSEDEVRDWHGRQAKRFANSPDDEALECWIDRAFAADHRAAAAQLVHAWRDAHGDDRGSLEQLAYYFEALREHGEEADTRARIVEQLTRPADIAGQLCALADAARHANRLNDAFTALARAAVLHRAAPDWRELGLGRDLVRAGFELAAASEPALARAAFALTEEFASATPRLPLMTVAAAVTAASQVGDHERVRHYQERLSEERAHVASQIASL